MSAQEQVEQLIRVLDKELKNEDGADSSYWEITGALEAYKHVLKLMKLENA